MSATATPHTAAHAIAVIKSLPPAELRKFNRQFSTWQQHGREIADDEALLLERIKENSVLPASQKRRFDRLRRKRQKESLTAGELEELQGFWRQVEQMNVQRLEALYQLAQRRGMTLREIMRELGFVENQDVF